MRTPLDNRPKITEKDIRNEYITRYFVRSVSSGKITEIDADQYNIFVNDPYFVAVKLSWIIVGPEETYFTADGISILGVGEQNQKIVEYYNKQIPGLVRKLRNPYEYVVKFISTNILPIQTTAEAPSSTTMTTPPDEESIIATEMTISPSSLTFNYQINSTVPTSQSLSVTADGTLSGIYIISGSSWVSASLNSSTAPTTVWVYPIVTGLYSGSYSSTVTVSTTQAGVSSVQVPITLNVTNNPDILFVYEPGMPLTSATFTRATSASYNELVS